MASITRAEPFTALAAVYQSAGFTTYSAQLAPRILEMAFEMEWTGRTLLDQACGTGELCRYFGDRGFRVTGADLSGPMLQIGTETVNQLGIDVQFARADIRTFSAPIQVDLVTCTGYSLNYIGTLRDLEAVFRQAHAALVPGKLYFFDLRTIKGLAEEVQEVQIAFDNNEDTLILVRSAFNYETLTLTRHYNILRYVGNTGWQRADEIHTLRGYPAQAVISLLNKTGFKVLRTLTPDLQPIDHQAEASALVFVATRES